MPWMDEPRRQRKVQLLRCRSYRGYKPRKSISWCFDLKAVMWDFHFLVRSEILPTTIFDYMNLANKGWTVCYIFSTSQIMCVSFSSGLEATIQMFRFHSGQTKSPIGLLNTSFQDLSTVYHKMLDGEVLMTFLWNLNWIICIDLVTI